MAPEHPPHPDIEPVHVYQAAHLLANAVDAFMRTPLHQSPAVPFEDLSRILSGLEQRHVLLRDRQARRTGRVPATPLPTERSETNLPHSHTIESVAEFYELAGTGDFRKPLKIHVGGHLIDMSYFHDDKARVYGMLAAVPRTHAMSLPVLLALIGKDHPETARSYWHNLAGPKSRDSVMAEYIRTEPHPTIARQRIVYLDAPAELPESPYVGVADPDLPEGVCMDEETTRERAFYTAETIEVDGQTVSVEVVDSSDVVYLLAKMALRNTAAVDLAERVVAQKDMAVIASAFHPGKAMQVKFVRDSIEAIRGLRYGALLDELLVARQDRASRGNIYVLGELDVAHACFEAFFAGRGYGPDELSPKTIERYQRPDERRRT